MKKKNTEARSKWDLVLSISGYLVSLFLNVPTVTIQYLGWKADPYTYESTEEMLWCFPSTGVSNYIQTVFSGGSLPIIIQAALHVDVIEATEHFKRFY